MAKIVLASQADVSALQADLVSKSVDSGIAANITLGNQPLGDSSAWVRIGNGSGTLPSASKSGLKVRIDSTATTNPSGVRSDIKIIDGTPGTTMQGIVSRVDLEDVTAADGDTVALWGDVIVPAASQRNTWGLNTFVQLNSSAGYQGTAHGAEIAVQNDDTANDGGILLLVARGSATVQYGIWLGGGPGTVDQVPMNHAIIIGSGTAATPLSVQAPLVNAFYYGPVGAGPGPTGTPFFQIANTGMLTFGGGFVAADSKCAEMVAQGEANPRLEFRSNGRIAFGNGSGAPDTIVRRAGVGLLGTAGSAGFVIGEATGSGGGYLQLWEQSADPSAPATNSARLFAKDNGAGKTQLAVRFPTGATAVLATEP